MSASSDTEGVRHSLIFFTENSRLYSDTTLAN